MHNTIQLSAARPLCLVAVRTVTGATTFIVTRRPDEQLGHLGTQLEVDQRLVVQTEHADEIAIRIRSDLNDKRLTAHEGNWFGVDWEAVLGLVKDFDPATGNRVRLADVSVGDEVWAKVADANGAVATSKCSVIGIVGRLYLLELHRPVGGVRRLAMPRSQIKPSVRVQLATAEAEAA